MFRALFVIALSSIGAAISGCAPCAAVCDCPAPLSLHVTTPDGRALEGVTLSGAPGTCSPAEDGAWCFVGAGGPGDLQLDVAAEGFRPVKLSRTVPGSSGEACCDCGYQPQQLSVPLQPL